MRSKWFGLKQQAFKMRKSGVSIRKIEKSLNIPRSTLSGWFRNVELTESQRLKLAKRQINHLTKARKKALKWHNQQKELRLRVAEEQAEKILSNLETNNSSILELALAMLYLGEGLKTKSGLGIGNADPLILKFFVNILIRNYGIEIGKIKCALHLRADQDAEKLKRYWSKQLDLPLTNFTSPSFDRRTTGLPTYSTYNGVCVVQCGNIAIQRKLLYLSRKFCNKVINES